MLIEIFIILILLLYIYLDINKRYKNIRGKINIIYFIVLIIIGVVITVMYYNKNKQKPFTLKCKTNSDCPSNSFKCINNECSLDKKLKSSIATYLNSVYPSKNDILTKLNDVELFNYFMTLGYYWVSYHNIVDNILTTVDNNYPENVQCGGYFPDSSNERACGSDPHTNIASTWPTTKVKGKTCCKPGTLGIYPENNQLYYIDYLNKQIEVLRNGYEYSDLLNKSKLVDPFYLYKNNKLNSKNPFESLCIIKDGTDNKGKNLSYNVCDKSYKMVDFTKYGPGYPSNSLIEVTRNRGTGGSPDIFYYVASGTGNFLNSGITIRCLNKIHGALLVIKRAGELDFGSFSSYNMKSSEYTTTKQVINLTDGTITNSFSQTPQLLLLEFFDRCQGKIAMGCPNKTGDIGYEQAMKVNSNVDWPFSSPNSPAWEGQTAPQGSPQISYHWLLDWFFKINNISNLPKYNDYINNWSSWNKNEVDVLGKFFDSVTTPYFKFWQLNYCMNRIANNEFIDVLFYQFVNPGKSEINGYSLDVNPKDIKGNPWNGIVNYDNKYIQTINFSIQPNGAGGWAYELIDYRLSIKSTQGPNDKKYWTKYANLFMKSGSQINNVYFNCNLNFCNDNDIYCQIGGDGSPSDWEVIMCNNPLNPTPPTDKYTCNNGSCEKSLNGEFDTIDLCRKNCSSPKYPKCKDISDGVQHNYCSGWCNTRGVWKCGINSDGKTTCDCSGCNGCP